MTPDPIGYPKQSVLCGVRVQQKRVRRNWSYCGENARMLAALKRKRKRIEQLLEKYKDL